MPDKNTYIKESMPFGYERHRFKNPEFPIKFHKDILKGGTVTVPNFVDTVRFVTHWHENIEILHVIDGEIRVKSGDEENNFKKGETAVINSGRFHHIEAMGEKAVYYCLIVDREFLSSKGINSDECIFKNKIADEEIGMYFDKIETTFGEKKNSLYKMRVVSFATLICERIYTYYRETEDVLADREAAAMTISKKVMKYVNKNFNSTIDVGEIAKQLGVSKFHMCHCFKACVGCGIVEFANAYKIDRAKALICSGEMNVSEAAEHCGFSNLSYFTRTFKKNTGFLPSEMKVR